MLRRQVADGSLSLDFKKFVRNEDNYHKIISNNIAIIKDNAAVKIRDDFL